MLMVISPAKTLDYESPLATSRFTQPALLEKSQQLIEIARELSPASIASLMGISDKLAHLNAERFNSWQPDFSLRMPVRQFWRSKVMSTPVYRQRPSAIRISILLSSICVCYRACMACCVHSI